MCERSKVTEDDRLMLNSLLGFLVVVCCSILAFSKSKDSHCGKTERTDNGVKCQGVMSGICSLHSAVFWLVADKEASSRAVSASDPSSVAIQKVAISTADKRSTGE